MKSRRVVLLPAIAFAVLFFTSSLWADSNIRSVRLSYVQGNVLIDHGTGQGFEPALMNMPVNASTRIKTGDDGLAEIEFENGSTLRLTGDTTVLFQPLSLTDKGIRISGMSISEGTAYIHAKKEKQDEFFLAVRDLHLQLIKEAHLRVSADSTQILVAVFKGELSDPQTGLTIKKNESFRIDNATDQITDVAQGIDPYFTDAWDQERDKYQKNPKKYPALATSSFAFVGYTGGGPCDYTQPPWQPYCPVLGPYGYGVNQINPGLSTTYRQPVKPPLPGTHGNGDTVVTLPKTVVTLPTVTNQTAVLDRPTRGPRSGTNGSMGSGGVATSGVTTSSQASAPRAARWIPLAPANNSRPSVGGTSGGGTTVARGAMPARSGDNRSSAAAGGSRPSANSFARSTGSTSSVRTSSSSSSSSMRSSGGSSSSSSSTRTSSPAPSTSSTKK